MKTKLFLSNNTILTETFQTFCLQNDIALTAASLIAFEAVVFEQSVTSDVIFFSSPRSFDFYCASAKLGNELLACIGDGTAAHLEKAGYATHFVGKNSGNPQKVAEDFRQWLGTRTVLFPLAEHSNRSISSVIPEEQRKEVIVYKTLHVPQVLAAHDIYVWTSPSNVHAFFATNRFPENAQTISWGASTSRALAEYGILPTKTLEESSLSALETVLREILHTNHH